jgi:putative ATP-dependent endonuclease of OLD family
MSILIDFIRISGFRGIANVEVSLPRITLLLGPNNSGKTSVIKAMQLAIGDYSRFLSDEDFHIDANDNRTEQILIDIRIIPQDDNGQRSKEFSDDWQAELGDKIQFEANDNEFVAIRTSAKPDKIKGGFSIERHYLEAWPDIKNWQQHRTNQTRSLKRRFEALPFIPIDAQRDIQNELKEKSSFIGKVLSNVEYADQDVQKLEDMVSLINKEAIDKSEPLKKLKLHLDQLNQSFEGSGQTELTPFPKKIRDLSKRFSIHFGESDQSSFSMEYHGMGTRSWASMLTVKAFTELMVENHQNEAEPYFPILAAEEPEAHLHPNAQRTLYSQLSQTPGQMIISTHSPYLAAMADTKELRVLAKNGDQTQVCQLKEPFEGDDLRKIKREVIHSRGELLFSRAIVLSEGETEEQALPQLFEAYTGLELFTLGINFIGVNGSGKKYKPFLLLARDLHIPVFIFSDGEEKPKSGLQKVYSTVFGDTDIDSAPNITVLNGTDFEGYLFDAGFEHIIEQAIIAVKGEDYIEKYARRKHGKTKSPTKTDQPPCPTCNQEIYESSLWDFGGEEGKRRAMLNILDGHKTMYAQALTEELIKLDSKNLPPKFIELFEQIKAGM